LFRGSRDAFTSHAFHARCDGIENTVIIIKSNLDHVFGGFTSTRCNLNSLFIRDPKAFLFRLRRKGLSLGQKFKVTKPEFAIRGAKFANRGESYYGPTFGDGYDIYIRTNSNNYDTLNNGGWTPNYSSFGNSYELPQGYKIGTEEANSYLAGASTNWFTDEIEVYQIFF
jgi:hypothetical protein